MAEGEILTAVPKAEAVALAEIHAMRQVADSMSAQTKAFSEAMAAHTRAVERLAEDVKGLGEEVRAVDRRLIHVEAAKVGEQLAAALTRIDALEADRDQRRGAKALVDWLRQTTPWLLAMFLAAAAALGWKDQAP